MAYLKQQTFKSSKLFPPQQSIRVKRNKIKFRICSTLTMSLILRVLETLIFKLRLTLFYTYKVGQVTPRQYFDEEYLCYTQNICRYVHDLEL